MNDLDGFHFTIEDVDSIHQAEQLALAEKATGAEVRTYPVCGVKSLVINYEEMDPSDVGYAHCLCCTFDVNSELKNPSTHKIPIDDFWSEEKIS